MNERDEARIYMNAVIPRLEDVAGPHPGVEALAAYQQSRLSGSARALVRDHLVTCDECLALFKDANDFFAPPPEGREDVSEVEIRREWKALWGQIKAEEGAAATAGAVAPRPSAPRLRKGLPLALAAGLAVAAALPLAWAVWSRQDRADAVRRLQLEQEEMARRLKQLEEENLRLREQARESRPPEESLGRPPEDSLGREAAESEQENQRLRKQLGAAERRHQTELAELRRPQLNAPLYDVLPQEMTVRSAEGEEVTRIVLSPRERSFTLILNGGGLPPYPKYDMEIRGRGGKSVWRGTGLRQDGGGNFVLTLDRGFLRDGRYSLKLFGRSAEGTKAVAEYNIHVTTGPPRQRP